MLLLIKWKQCIWQCKKKKIQINPLTQFDMFLEAAVSSW